MLVFADHAWHVFNGVLIFFVGLGIALAQKRIFRVPQKRAIALYLWHSSFCIFYLWYSLNNAADSTLYFIRSHNYDLGFRFGTAGIYYFVSLFTQGLKLSYGNVFLIFNILGYVGLLAFASALKSVTANSKRNIRFLSGAFLYLPSISFWSSAIGKDSLTFMAAGLVTWAVLDISKRMPAIILGTFLFLLPRPHMAGIFLISFCLALLGSSSLGTLKKLALLTITIPMTIVSVQFGLSYAGLDSASDIAGVNEYFQARQGHNLGGGSSVDIAGMSMPMRLLTYMFRPLFFDANGILGLVVSLENLFLLLLFVMAILRTKRTKSNLGRFAFMFYLMFTIISWLILANTTANLGIAIRQKIMFLPMFIVLLFSLWNGAHKSQSCKTTRTP